MEMNSNLWSESIKELFDGIITGVPIEFREFVKVLLKDTTEGKCAKRNGTSITEDDLLISLFEITPEPFKKDATENAIKLGIDVSKYLNKESSSDEETLSIERIHKDLENGASMVGVDFNAEAVQKVLHTFSSFFLKSPVSFRTTTKDKLSRDLSLRYVELFKAHDPMSLASSNNLLQINDHPVYNLIPGLQSTGHNLGYGIDLNVSKGLSKIWSFFTSPISTEEAINIRNLAPGVKKHKDYFLDHDLKTVSVFGADYLSNTMNIYFMIFDNSLFPKNKIAKMLKDLNLFIPTNDILERCSNNITIYFTFNWETEKVQRICFGMVAENKSELPNNLGEELQEFVDNPPIFRNTRRFIYSISMSEKTYFTKIEPDYTGTMIDLMMEGVHTVGKILNK